MALIPSGEITENQSGWLSGEKWTEVLVKLQNQADLMIVDGPSLEAANTQLLAARVDAVLLAIRLGATRVDSAKTALKRFQFVGAKVAGIVVYRAPRYQTLYSQIFHRARAKKKGGSQETSNKPDEETTPIS
jgi:Mrp family chromosome partitioning ATPase